MPTQDSTGYGLFEQNQPPQQGQQGQGQQYLHPHQQQHDFSQTYGNSNPFTQNASCHKQAPSTETAPASMMQQQAMVSTHSHQYANQWSLQQHQQAQPALAPQPNERSVATYIAPTNTQSDRMDPFAGTAPVMVPQVMQPTTHNQQQPFSHTTNAYREHQPAQPSQDNSSFQQVPAQPPVVNTTANDDDFFGVFSAKSKEPSAAANPTREIETYESHDTLSVLSGGTDPRSKGRSYLASPSSHASGGGDRISPLDNPKFAPPPPKIRGLENSHRLAREAPPTASPLPSFDLVTHSGFCMARISFRTILIKKWKQVFWITYGHNKLYVFRSVSDFQDWVANPFLSQGQRDFLIKLKVDFVEDSYKMNVRGYQVTNIRMKAYQSQML